MIIHNTNSESDDDEKREPLVYDGGHHEGYRRILPQSPRRISYSEGTLSYALGDNLRSPKMSSSGSPLKKTKTKLEKMSSSVMLPQKRISRGERPPSLECDDESSNYLVTEDNESVPFSSQTPITPIAMVQPEESEGSQVTIVGDRESHEVALQRYYADEPKNSSKAKDALKVMDASKGKDCRIV
jgi:hypothetical protein